MAIWNRDDEKEKGAKAAPSPAPPAAKPAVVKPGQMKTAAGVVKPGQAKTGASSSQSANQHIQTVAAVKRAHARNTASAAKTPMSAAEKAFQSKRDNARTTTMTHTVLDENVEQWQRDLAQQLAIDDPTLGKNPRTKQILVDMDSVKNEEQAMYFSLELANDGSRERFLRDYAKHTGIDAEVFIESAEDALGEKLFKSPVSEGGKRKATIKDAMTGLAGYGLIDVNGRDINIQSADFNTTVQGIRNIADEDDRSAAFKYLTTLTKTQGSRFYGYSMDGVDTSYRDSALLPEAEYKEYTDSLAAVFDPSESGYQNSLRQYQTERDAILERYANNPVAQRQYLRALDKAFESQMGVKVPNAEELRTVIAQQDEEDATKAAQKEAENEDGGFLDWVAGKLAGSDLLETLGVAAQQATFGGTSQLAGYGGTDVKPSEDKPAEEKGALQRFWDGLTGKTAREWKEAKDAKEAPQEGAESAQEQPPMAFHFDSMVASTGGMAGVKPMHAEDALDNASRTAEEASQVIKPSDMADVVTAFRAGKIGQIADDDPYKQAFAKQMESSPEFRYIISGTGDVDQLAYNQSQSGGRGAEFVTAEGIGKLGTTAANAYNRIMSDTFPEELRSDALLVLADLAVRAATMEQNGQLGGDAGDAELAIDGAPLLERLLTTDPMARDQLNGVFKQAYLLTSDRRKQLADEQATSQATLNAAKEAVLRGEYSDEQYALVLENANKDPQSIKANNQFVVSAKQKIGSFFSDPNAAVSWENSDAYRAITDNGVINPWEYQNMVYDTMCEIASDYARVAGYLDMSADDYLGRLGGMDMNALCNAAVKRITQNGQDMTPQDEETVAELEERQGVGYATAIGAGAYRGTNYFFGAFQQSLYEGMQESDVIRKSEEMRLKYTQPSYGINGPDTYRMELQALIDSDTLDPSYAKALQQAIYEADDIFAIGIDPGRFTNLRENGAACMENVRLVDEFAAENMTESERSAYGISGSTVLNLWQTGTALVGTALTGSTKLGQMIGYGVIDWGENFHAALDEGYGRETSKAMANLKTAGHLVANSNSFEHLFKNVKGFSALWKAGANSAIRANPTGVFKAIAGTRLYALGRGALGGAKALAGQIKDELVDEAKEALSDILPDTVYAPYLQAQDAGEPISASEYLKTAVSNLKNYDYGEMAKEYVQSIPEVVAQTALMSVIGAFGNGVSTYKSVRIAQGIMSGKSTIDEIGYTDAEIETEANAEADAATIEADAIVADAQDAPVQTPPVPAAATQRIESKIEPTELDKAVIDAQAKLADAKEMGLDDDTIAQLEEQAKAAVTARDAAIADAQSRADYAKENELGEETSAQLAAEAAGLGAFKNAEAAGEVTVKASVIDKANAEATASSQGLLDQFLLALEDDLTDPDFCAQYDNAAAEARTSAAFAYEIIYDNGSDGVKAQLKATNEQIASHEATLAASRAALDQANATVDEVQTKIDNGEATEADMAALADAQEAAAKNRNNVEEVSRELEQKKAEARDLGRKRVENARAAAAEKIAAEDAYRRESARRIAQEMAQLAPQIAQRARQSRDDQLAAKIQSLYDQMAAEYEKGDTADFELIERLGTELGILSMYQEEISGSDSDATLKDIEAETQARLDEIAQEKEGHASQEVLSAMQAQEERVALEEEQKTLLPVFNSLRGTKLYVNKSQMANILYETGYKNLSEVNKRLGLQLTQDASALPLDSGFFADLKQEAPGYFREEWDAHPEAALTYFAQKRKMLKQDIADAKQAEADARKAYEDKRRSAGDKPVKKIDVPPGYALSQFENKTAQKSDVIDDNTKEMLAGTTHKVITDEQHMRKAAERIAQNGLDQTFTDLMAKKDFDAEDIAAARACMARFKKSGHPVKMAMLSAKLGAQATKSGRALRLYSLFQKQEAETAVSDAVQMADAYNKKKGRRRKQINTDAATDAEFSLGETKYQPFMENEVSLASSDPVMQKLGSDVHKRSGLRVVWARMDDGLRGFFDRGSGTIILNQKVGASEGAYITAIHEYTHFLEESKQYPALAKAVLDAAYGKNGENQRGLDTGAIRDEYNARGLELTEDLLQKELVAAATERILLGDEAFMRTLFAEGNGGVAVRMLAGIDEFLRKRDAKKKGEDAVKRYELIRNARNQLENAVNNAGKWKAGQGEGQAFSFVGRSADGKGIYASNFSSGTPRQVKINHFVDLWKNVWNKQPIQLEVIDSSGQRRKVTANFSPEYDPQNQQMTDLGKVLHSKNGSSGDRTITLNLADDLHDIASEAVYVDSEKEIGKNTSTHKGVTAWHYFSNDFIYRNSDGDKPMTLWLDLKEKNDGGWVYQMYAKKTKKDDSSKPREISSARPEETSSDINVSQNTNDVNTNSMQNDVSYSISRRDRLDEIGNGTDGEQQSIDVDALSRQPAGVTARKVLQNLAAIGEDVSTDNEWGVPLNGFQREQIAKRGLSGVSLPGLNYNRATLKQRELCAIMACPQDNRGPGLETLTQQLDAMEDGYAVTTDADINFMMSQAAIVEASAVDAEGRPLDREGQVAYGRMRDAQINIIPVSDSQKRAAWRYMGMLSAPVTTIKNVSGLVLMHEADRASKAGVIWLDKLIAKKTGTRSLSIATRDERRAGTQAAIQRGRDVFDDAFVTKTSTSRSRNYNAGGDGRVFQTEALEIGRNIINFMMDAPDQVAIEKELVEEMAMLRRLEAKIVDEETGEMRPMTEQEIYEEAYRRASERHFHEDNFLTAMIFGVQNAPYVGRAFRVIVPFVKTPANVAMRMLDYSPVGLAKSLLYDGLWNMKTNVDSETGVGVNFDQYKFVMGVGRGLTGTGVAVAGALLYSLGVLSFGREEEENDKRRGILQALGEPYSMYINIGDTKHEVNFTLPVTAGLAFGAKIMQSAENDEGLYNAVSGALGAQFNAIFDNTYLSSINDIFSGYADTSDKALAVFKTGAESYVTQMVSPAIVRAIAKAADPYARDTSSQSGLRQMLNTCFIQNWPLARKMLPIKTDISGDKMTQFKAYQEGGAWENGVMHFVDSFLSPTSTYSDKDDPALMELMDLSYRSGETSFLPSSFISANKYSVNIPKTQATKWGLSEDSAVSIHLTDAQKRMANELYSTLMFNGTQGTTYTKPNSIAKYQKVTGIRELMESPGWQRMTDTEKVKAVESIKNQVTEIVRAQVAMWQE